MGNWIYVLLPVFIVHEVGRHAQAVLAPFAFLGTDVDLEACGAEDVVWVLSLADEDTCVASTERGFGGGDGDESALGKGRHFW